MNKQDKWAEEAVERALVRLREAAPVAEPEAGWEARLLQRLRSELSPARRDEWRYWFTVSGFAVALGLLIWAAIPPLPGPPPMSAAMVATVSMTPPQPAVRVAMNRPAAAHVPAVAHRHREFAAVFPTPTPLTEQERLLLRYVATAPPEELARMVKEMKSDNDDPSKPFGSLR